MATVLVLVICFLVQARGERGRGAAEDLWWTFDTPEAIAKKIPLSVGEKKLGGVFAWGLGEDAPEWKHLKALNDALTMLGSSKDEL